jgi:DNA-directed RNA polymerase specialized sigma subunit
MCIIGEEDILEIIQDKKLFARFDLNERERKIMELRIVKGMKFTEIAVMEERSVTVIQRVFKSGLRKMKKQMLWMVKSVNRHPDSYRE